LNIFIFEGEFVMQAFPTTNGTPPSMAITDPDEPKYDWRVHLALGQPESLMLIGKNGSLVPHGSSHAPEPASVDQRSNLAYTAPFQYLSDAGVTVVRKIIDDNKKFSASFGDGMRVPVSLRGLGYRSQFIRDLNCCPVANGLLAKFAGVDLVPHSYETSWGHCNIGVLGDTRAVDQWHIDSVPFVLVVLLSDLTGASGGELEVVKKVPFQAAFDRIKETGNQVPADEMLQVAYPGLGWAILMQGSHFVHHVTPVAHAKEARITMVNSYQCPHPDYPDDTRYSIFKNETETAAYEFARHRAARVRNQLDQFLQTPGWVSDITQLTPVLRKAADELSDSIDVLEGKRDDGVPFYRENAPS
jgi:hypothetical protein